MYLNAISTLIFISHRLYSEHQIKKKVTYIYIYIYIYTGRARWSYSLRRRSHLFDFCNRRFESRRRYEYWSVVFVVWYVGSGLCDEMMIYSEGYHRVCVSVCVCGCVWVCVWVVVCGCVSVYGCVWMCVWCVCVGVCVCGCVWLCVCGCVWVCVVCVCV